MRNLWKVKHRRPEILECRQILLPLKSSVRLRDPMRKVGHGWAALDPQLHQARVWDTKKSLPASRSAQAVDWRIYLLPQTTRNGGL